MKRKINSISTFKIIKDLPLEVKFGEVENWVNQHRLDAVKERMWLPYFLARWWEKLGEN
ncbi:MAG: hypothetical protein AB8G22_06960 [Saprospiraceae bacterium]